MGKKKNTGVYFEKGNNYHINDSEKVKVYEYDINQKIKIRNCGKFKNNYLSDYKKLNKQEYVNIQTGEIKKYEIGEFKSPSSLKKSMNNLKELLLNNFNGGKNEEFLTLTYTEEETDFDKTGDDLGDFWKKLKKKYKDIEYIGVIEKQKSRNSWHIHMVLKNKNNQKLFIPQEEIVKIWNKGQSVWITPITDKGIKNVIKQLSKINDYKKFEYDEEQLPINRVINYMSKIQTKEEIPSFKKSYYKSRGIIFPKVSMMNYDKAQKLLNDNCYLLYEKTILIKSVLTDKILKRIKEELYQN